jgi:hypothetical protein
MGRGTRRAAWVAGGAVIAVAVAVVAWTCNEAPTQQAVDAQPTPRASQSPRGAQAASRATPTMDGAPASSSGRRARPRVEATPPKPAPADVVARAEQLRRLTNKHLGEEHTADNPFESFDDRVRPPVGASFRVRDWTPANGSLAATSDRRPNTRVARRPDAVGAATTIDTDAATATSHGLRGDYFDLLDGALTDVPDVKDVLPTFSRIDRAIDFDTDAAFALPFTPDTFVVRWTGFLRAPQDGECRFTIGSDDGARLTIDDAVVVDQPRLRPYGESSGAVKLAAGLHPVEVLFYENQGYASCRLWWSGPSWTRTLVAPEFLSPPADLAGVVPPVIASVDPSSGSIEDTVVIAGVGLGDASSRVTFHGVPAEIASASADRLVVTVPIGAATGDVVVQVGELSSRPRSFEVKNLLGLFGEYWKLDGELTDWPDFAHFAPYFVRLDANLDFLEDDLWALPHEPDVFAARHSGFLYVPQEDDYRLTLGGDDGVRVTLDGRRILDLPGLHPYAEQSRTLRLAKGFHPIETLFFENYGEARLALFWQRASEPTRSVIPEGFFFAPRELSDLPTPVLTSLAPRAAEIGGDVEIRGAGFGTNERLVRVVFPGGVWARATSVDDERIRVRVPYGVESGALRVEVGIKSSGELPFTVATPQGLVADYLAYVDRASLEAAVADRSIQTAPAAFTRVETSWQRTSAADWNLPFPASTFAVHWHGTLAVEHPTDVGWILRAAAGAYLLVDGAFVVDCGPWHELEERYGTSRLAAGEHRFDLWFAQSGADPRIQLLFTPLGRLEHLPVPGRWFLPREPRPTR